MAVDMEKARAVIDRVRSARFAGTLTREEFMEAWRELEAIVGQGEEAEAMEGLILFADPRWIDDLGLI